jgi:predicted nucleotidyltransferase
MADPVSGNLAMLMRVVDRLALLLDRFVFLGGVVTELLITSPAAGSPRQTKDVDVIVNVLNMGEYSETLRERFLACGLVEDMSPGAPVCRWCLDDLIVDIMPTRGEILAFSCEWYQVAFDTAQPTMLPNGSMIRLVTPACFLATKLAAFGDRGRRDPMASHDLEDVITVVHGRESIVDEIQASPPEVRAFVAAAWRELLETGSVPALLESHLAPDEASQARAGLVLSRIEAMARFG